MLHAFADVVVVGRGHVQIEEFGLLGRRQGVERGHRRRALRRQGDAKRAQPRRLVDAAGDHFLFDLRGDRPPVGDSVKIEKVFGVFRGDRDIDVGAFPDDVGHRKRDEADDVGRRGVEEAIADADFLLRNEQVLGAHLHVRGPGEDQPAGGQFGG